MLDSISVPRRALDFEDYIDILRRNFVWVLGPVFAGLVVSTVVAFLLPDTFVSTALIRIVPQQIPDNLVQNVSTQQLADHINAMVEGIKSRNTLTTLINTYHLYKSDLKSEPLEDVINKMSLAIVIRPTAGIGNVSSGRTLPAMQVSFTYDDAHVAKQVLDDIVGRFMSQNSQDSLEAQESANQFLSDEFERAKRELNGYEQRLADFRTRNAGRLPEQMELNIQQMNALSMHASQLNQAVNRNSEQRMLIESAVRSAKDRMTAIRDIGPQTQTRNDRVTELDKQISLLETRIEDMKDRYTDSFPDLQQARQQLSVLQRQRDQAVKNNAGKDSGQFESPGATRERLDAQSQVDGLQAQLKANEMEGQQITRELGAVNAEMRSYQSRLQGVPAGEKEYAELIHNRDLAKQHYDELEAKRNRSTISMHMESRKQGETLEVLDAASLPSEPTAPKRAVIIPMGPAVGLVLGMILVAIREVKDTSLKNLKDARLYTQLSILGSIPLLENDLVVQRRKQIMLVGWAAATLVGLAIIAGSVAHYYLNLNKA